MFKRCSHKWTEIDRHFTGSAQDHGITNVGASTSYDHQQKILWGVTTVELKCDLCGDLKSFVIKGDARKHA